MRAIVLVGFMGAGKSSVGAALSRRLGWPFEDLDERIQAREQRSIEEIFRQSGEAAFRQLEHAALGSLIAELGASPRWLPWGVVLSRRRIMPPCSKGPVSTIFLDAPVEELFRRCRQQQVDRPLRGDLDEFRRLYETRRPCYLKAGLRIDTAGKDVDRVAAEVIDSLGLR